MRIALVDSGIGMLSTAAALRVARPDADLFLSMDPDHMPWGPRTPDEIVARALAGARAAQEAAGDAALDAVVVPCNTASVHGLAELRAEFEPDVPVIGTVPGGHSTRASPTEVTATATEATTATDARTARPRVNTRRLARGMRNAFWQAERTAINRPGWRRPIRGMVRHGRDIPYAVTVPEVSPRRRSACHRSSVMP